MADRCRSHVHLPIRNYVTVSPMTIFESAKGQGFQAVASFSLGFSYADSAGMRRLDGRLLADVQFILRMNNPSRRANMAAVFVRKSAIISDCGLYRYELRRIWDDALPPYVSGMLNPSKADAEIDDPTIIRNRRRADAMGCGSLIVWNLGAGRATDPDNWKSMADPIGPENDAHIRRILIECRERNGIATVGWGTHGSFRGRDCAVLKIAAETGVKFRCLGITKDGKPRHPLYVAHGQPLVEWTAAVEICGKVQ